MSIRLSMTQFQEAHRRSGNDSIHGCRENAHILAVRGQAAAPNQPSSPSSAARIGPGVSPVQRLNERRKLAAS